MLVRGAFVVAVLLTLFVAFALEERARGRSAWKSYQDDARARQVKLNLVDFVPPPVPDERNFAAIPLFQDVFADPASANSMKLPEGGVKQPAFGGFSKGQLPDLEAWRKLFLERNYLSAASNDVAADVLRALERYAPQWDQLRAAAKRPESRFPVRYEDGLNTALPHVQIFQSAGRINSLRMACHLAQGDSATAYGDVQMGLRLYRALENEPTLIAGLVRLSMLGMLENGIWTGLAQRQWAAPELEKIEADFGRLRLMDDYVLALGSERGGNNMIYDQLVHNGTGDLANLISMTHDGDPRPNSRVLTALLVPYPSGWLLLSQTRANRYFDEMLARVSQEPPRIYPERPVRTMPANIRDVGLAERAQYMLFLLMIPALSEIERNYAFAQTAADEARIACALERHRLANDGFPASLDALVPAFLSPLPGDVMTGEPLHYRLGDDGGYVLYSVGWNLQDDGGKFVPVSYGKQQIDWVWMMPGK